MTEPIEDKLNFTPYFWEKGGCLKQFTAYPVYFLSVRTNRCSNQLTDKYSHNTMCDEWRLAQRRYGWCVGRYLILPDRAHFSCVSVPGERVTSLSYFVERWKKWTARRIIRQQGDCADDFWRKGYSCLCLRLRASCASKWNEVRETVVRLGLTDRYFQGFIAFDEPW